MPVTWPVRTREHVDLWLHSYALLTSDTTLVPYFRPGYRDRLLAVRRQRGVSTQLDANRAKLFERLAVNPALATNGQFLPLYFASWDQMRQMIDLFELAGGKPSASYDQNTRAYNAIMSNVFPSAPYRD